MVSLIIPVYNIAPWLDQCLHSVSGQSCQEWECLLVDDGSTDGSGRLCDNWARQDPRFTVLHQVNRGAAAARNAALEKARGEFVSFIDSDDYVDTDYLATLLQGIRKEDADLCVCGFKREQEGPGAKLIAPEADTFFSLDAKHSDRFLELIRKHLLFGPVSKMYRREQIVRQNARFDERFTYGEDLMFNLAYLQGTETIASVASAPYHYRIHGTETLSTRFRADRFRTDYIQWKALEALFAQKGLLTDAGQAFLYERLWGHIYDGIFQFPQMKDTSYSYLQQILAIPEIDRLNQFKDSFSCADWIKNGILHRRARSFYLYFKFRSRK